MLTVHLKISSNFFIINWLCVGALTFAAAEVSALPKPSETCERYFLPVPRAYQRLVDNRMNVLFPMLKRLDNSILSGRLEAAKSFGSIQKLSDTVTRTFFVPAAAAALAVLQNDRTPEADDLRRRLNAVVNSQDPNDFVSAADHFVLITRALLWPDISAAAGENLKRAVQQLEVTGQVVVPQIDILSTAEIATLKDVGIHPLALNQLPRIDHSESDSIEKLLLSLIPMPDPDFLSRLHRDSR